MVNKSNIGERIKPTGAFIQTDTWTAGSATYDNVLVTSAVVDRQGFASAQLQVGLTNSLASGETAKGTFNIYDCTTSTSTFTSYSAVAASVTLKTGTTSANKTVAYYNIDLSGAKQFIKIDAKVDLSASGTDTASYFANLVLGGADKEPVA
jgi:hypothetical protein